MIEVELGENIVGVTDDTPAPPPATPTAEPIYTMAADEQFTREQYHAAGWTDKQLIQQGKMIVIAAPPEEIDLEAPVGMPPSAWIIVDDNDDVPPTGLFVSVNGYGYLIKTSVPVFVPESVIEVLDHAIMSKPIVDTDSKKIIGYEDRRRYNYRRVEAPAEAA